MEPGTLPDLDELRRAEAEAAARLLELERSAANGATQERREEIEAEIDTMREILSRTRYQKYLVAGELDAIFPPDEAKQKLRTERETCRYWMEQKKPDSIQGTHDRPTKPVLRRRLEHSATTDYERDKWAVMNILLETLQNAEPNDSGGTWFGIEIFAKGKWRLWPLRFSKQEGRWMPARELSDFQDNEIEAVRIIDNGGGYAPTELKIFGSSKSPDSDAGGLFGEGGNMADVTACRLGIQVKKSSRNWQARPCLSKERATGRTVQQLCYDTEFHDDMKPGTAVEFRGFGGDFVQALRTVQDYYLPLRGHEYTTLSQTFSGDIVETKDTNVIFVKGRAYPLVPEPEKPFLFSYNLTRFVVQDRNRSRVPLSEVISHITHIWNNNRNRQAVKDLITAHKNGHACYELAKLGEYSKYYPWDDGMLDLFGEVACEVYDIPDPKKTFSTMGKGYEEAEKFLREKGGWSALTIGGSEFLTDILKKRFKSTVEMFNAPEVPGALACTEAGDILERGTQVFSHGKVVRIEPAFQHPPLFSYNLKHRLYESTVVISELDLRPLVVQIWAHVTSESQIRELFEAYKARQKTYELSCVAYDVEGCGESFPAAPLFAKIAYEVFGIKNPEKCFLKAGRTDARESELALEEKGYQSIDVSKSAMLWPFLHAAKIPTAEEILERHTTYKPIEVSPKAASKKLNERKLLTGLWRFVAGLCREGNHEGTCDIEILMLKKGKNGEETETWIPYKQWVEGVEGYRMAIRFVARGGAAFTPDRLDYEERGKHRPTCLHALCSFMTMGHRIPFTIKSGNMLIRMEDERAYKIQSLGENGTNGETTITLFDSLDGLEGLLRDMKKWILDLNPDYKPLERTPHGDLVAPFGGEIYRFGMLDETPLFGDPDDPGEKLSYCASYAVRDTDPATPSRILEQLSNVKAIQEILRKASQENNYADIKGMTHAQNPKAWKEAFLAEFGNKTVVNDGKSMLGTAVAERFEYRRIDFAPSLTKILADAGVPCLTKLASVGEYKEETGLSENTQAVVDFGANIRSWLQEKLELMGVKAGESLIVWDPTKVKVVRKLKNKNGDDLQEFGGFFDAASGNIFIFANRLEELSKALQVMIRVMNYSLGDVFKDHVQASLYMDNVFSTLMECLVKSELVRNLLGQPLETFEHNDLEVGLTSLFGEMTDEVKQAREKRQMLLRNRIKKYYLLKRKRLAEGLKKLRRVPEHFREAMRQWSEARRQRRLEKAAESREREPRKFSIPNIQGATRAAAIFLFVGGVAILTADRVNWQRLLNELHIDPVDLHIPDFRNWLPDIDLPDIKFPDFFKENGRAVYQRPLYSGRYVPSVTAKSQARGITPEMETAEWQETVFLSNPNYDPWDGFLMSDYEFHEFDGTHWNHDSSAPQFSYPNYPDQLSWMHLQSITSPGEVFIRTQSGGIIDLGSIQVLDGSGNKLRFTARPEENGLVLDIPEKGAEKVVYVTKMPVNWEETARAITDADYASLPQDTYRYYTSTPSINLATIPFSWDRFPQARNWQEFFDGVRKLPLYERFLLLRDYVKSREYSDDPATARAYGKFQMGLLPEKTLIEFLIRGAKLPSVAAGDCDVHNTLLAWTYRMVGIPAKMDVVMNGDHGVTNAFLPKIGWVVSDGVGNRMRFNPPQASGTLSPEAWKEYQQALLRQQRVNTCVNKQTQACERNPD